MSPAIETPTYQLHPGSVPLLISIPHLGTSIPAQFREIYTDEALQTGDSDWHLDQVYAMAKSLGASMLGAKVSRYIVDLNRPPSGESLYPGQNTTGLCPLTTFHGNPLYKPGCEPDAAEVQRRLESYWKPYHQALASEIGRLRAQHGQVLVWEAHSIASVIPRLFDGKLPDLNFGTHGGLSCDSQLFEAATAPLTAVQGFSHVVNGRFKGGYNTRHYGNPASGVHTIQLEMCQSLYMNEAYPYEYRDVTAQPVQKLIGEMLSAGLSHLQSHAK